MKRNLQDILFPERYFRATTSRIPGIPAYFYHQAEVQEFDNLCRQIVRAGFSPITVNQLLDSALLSTRSVLLTFDDGWSSVWSVAFPLARRYDLRFTLFLVPWAIEESDECRPTMDDGASAMSLTERDLGSRGMLTWGEVQAMHRSGLVEIQSHSLHHGVVFTGNTLDGFCTPAGPFPLPGLVPLVQHLNGQDMVKLKPAPGTPLYPWAPALATPRRYIESSELRQRCLDVVEVNGGVDFFNTVDWQTKLYHQVNQFEQGTWESEPERRERLRTDLSTAKQLIEEHLPGSAVRAIAPPWAEMHPDLPIIAQETGYEVVVLGYPFPGVDNKSPIPLYPRLKGDAIWMLLHGPTGLVKWWQTRRNNLARQRAGAIP